MAKIGGLTTVAVVVAGMLLQPVPATAGPWWDWVCGKCPPPSYCALRYWTPTAARAYDCVKGPHLNVYPPDRHPEIPATMDILHYPCPPVPDRATLYTVPSPPAESRFQYFEQRGAGSIVEPGTGRQP